MTKHLSRADLRAAGVDLDSILAGFVVAKPRHHSNPFAKREAGRQRRTERKFVRAGKRAWLDGGEG